MDTLVREAFLTLVRYGIGHPADPLSFPVPWEEIHSLAVQQRLAAIIMDGIDLMAGMGDSWGTAEMEDLLKKQWISEVIQLYEGRYERYRKAIGELAGFYNANGIKMMVLKGLACSLTWPWPSHRPAGDIDIWLFGAYREADALVAAQKGIKVDSTHHHHTVFCWQGFTVENHYDFINVHHHRSSASLEKTLKKLGQDDSHFTEVGGERVYVPSPDLHSLFLLRHSMSNFASTDSSLRQLLDWAFYVQAHGSEIDWPWLTGVLREYGMMPLFHIFNAICVEDLGFDAFLFPKIECDPELKERVLSEILSPEFKEKTPTGKLARVLFKFRRWRANAWKHRLCYKESMCSAFWSGLWNHLLKPSSI